MNEATSENKQTQLLAIGDRVGLRPDRVHEIADRYAPALNILEAEYPAAMAIVVTDAEDNAGMLQARTLRLHLRKFRVQLDKDRSELGADAMKEKQAIDQMAKFLRDSYEIAESHLQQQEDFAKRIEAKRLDELAAERIEILAGLNFPTNNINVREMNDDEWSFMRDRAQQAFDAEAQKKIDAENERLRLVEEAATAKTTAETARLELEAEQLKTAALETANTELAQQIQRFPIVIPPPAPSPQPQRSDSDTLRAWASQIDDCIDSSPQGMSDESRLFVLDMCAELLQISRQLEQFATDAETAALAASDAEKQIDGNCPDCGFELTDGECKNEHCPEPF